MSIQEKCQEVKTKARDAFAIHGRDLMVALAILLACTLGYGAGLLGQGNDQGAAVITSFMEEAKEAPVQAKSASSEVGTGEGSTVYASKNGTRYYFANCSGLSRIKPENKVLFPNPAAAEATGLTLAANCHP